MDAFISWTKADEEVKNVIVKRLQEAGVSCWDSDRHCVSDFAYDCITAIRQSSVFIVIVSDASMCAGYVQNEITEARNQERLGKLNLIVYKITDAPYTEQFSMLLNHISFVTGDCFQRTNSVAGVSDIDRIVDRTVMLLKKRASGNPEKPYDVYIPEIDGLKLTKSGYFVEGSRDRVLQQMEDEISRSNVLILSEFIGYGKRSIIKKFVEQNHHRYTTAIMVHNEHANLREFFSFGLTFLNVNENVFAELQGQALIREKFKFLGKLDSRTLLVIPDIHFELQPDTALCEMLAGLKCHVLLLTQESANGYEDWFPVIRVGRMTDNHLYELFFHHYIRAFEEEKEALRAPLTDFFSNIGGHTKTVELTAATLNWDMAVPVEELPRYLSMHSDEGMQLKDRILQQIGSIFDPDRLGMEACVALLVAAYTAVPYISERHYRDILRQCGVENWQIVTELDKLRWLDVDIQNRTVSVEPLVAQIVFAKLPKNYYVMCCCLDYLYERFRKYFSFTVMGSEAVHIMNKLTYFFTVTELPECAEIITQLLQYWLEGKVSDPDKMTGAIKQFENAHLGSPAELLYQTEEEELPQYDEEPLSETWDESEENERRKFENQVTEKLVGLLPFAKLVSRNQEGVIFDYSSEGSRLAHITMKELPDDDVGILEYLGLSWEELTEIRTFLQEMVQSRDELEEDYVESAVITECLAVIECVYKRDHIGIQVGIANLLDHLDRLSIAMFNDDMMDCVLGVFKMIFKICAATGAYSAALVFVEKLLHLHTSPRHRINILFFYINILRSDGQYVPELYASYDKLLKSFDKEAQDIFDLHTDMLIEKKDILLKYAEDLVKGEQIDDALIQFAAARKIAPQTYVKQEAVCASWIVDILVKTGGFERALAFVKQYFPAEVVEHLAQTGDPTTQEIMEDFQIYHTVGQFADHAFIQDANPREHINYYQEFSRKNNSLLERKYLSVADDALDFDFSSLTDEEIAAHAQQLRRRAKKEKMLQLAPEAFALASEAGYRVLGYRHHLVQYMGAAAMAEGKIAEILNGEGKTYTILLTAFLHHLYGRQVFVIDQSDHLTSRNYQWMRGVYDLLGISAVQLSQSIWTPEYLQKVVYADLKTFIFSYLNFESDVSSVRSGFPMDTVIIDEADTTLVDMAVNEYRSVNAHQNQSLLTHVMRVWEFVKDLPEDDTLYVIDQKKGISLQSAIYPLIEARFSVSYMDIRQLDEITKIERSIMNALRCRWCYEREKDYFILNDTPVWEDCDKGVFVHIDPEFCYYLCMENELDTQSVRVKLSQGSKTTNSICLRDFFKRFRYVCGTTATAVSFREEFKAIYDLDCYCVPPHSPVVRKDVCPPLYLTLRAKEQAIIDLVQQKAEQGQPMLIITSSTKESERYSRLLKRRMIRHKLLNAKNTEAFSDVLANAGVFGSVLVANALAGRGADIKLGGNPELKTRQELVEMGEDIAALDRFVYFVPTPEQKASSLYQKYYSMLERNKAVCAVDRQRVVAAGGLCVIGTSFFDEPRTEQQTRGRSGRQGEVGESWAFQSIEDEKMQAMLGQAMKSFLEAQLVNDGIDTLESPILQKTIQNAQKKMHRLLFDNIRKRNDNDRQLEKAREEFIGRRFALQEGRLSVKDMLQEWARNKWVLEQLQLLQKGEQVCNSPALNYLFGKYSQLKTAKGGKTAEIVFDVVLQEMAAKRYGPDFLQSELLRNALCKEILRAWASYIEIIEDTVGRVNMTERAFEQFLNGEKQRLIRDAMERLICCR